MPNALQSGDEKPMESKSAPAGPARGAAIGAAKPASPVDDDDDSLLGSSDEDEGAEEEKAGSKEEVGFHRAP